MVVPHRSHKRHRNRCVALPQSNEGRFPQPTQVLRAERDEERLLPDIKGADVNDHVLCTRNMEESGFKLRAQKV